MIHKEVCDGCNKSICIGQATLECKNVVKLSTQDAFKHQNLLLGIAHITVGNASPQSNIAITLLGRKVLEKQIQILGKQI